MEQLRAFSAVMLIFIAWIQFLWPPMVLGQTKAPKSATEGSSKKPTSKEGGLQEVIAEGAGATPAEALKDAFRNAVRQVVGTVVSAETLVLNDEIVEDKVLTFSNGFIKTYDKLTGSEKLVGSIHQVKIKAKVERRSVLIKLRAANIPVKDVDGTGLFAEAVTKMDAVQNASELLKDALDGFPASIISATVIGKPTLVPTTAESAAKDAGKVTVSVNVDVAVDLDRYTLLQQRLSEILKKVAVRQGRCQLETKAANKDQANILDHHMRGGSISPFIDLPMFLSGLPPITKTGLFEPLRVPVMRNDMGAFGRVWWTANFDKKLEMVVVLNTGRSKTSDRTTWEWFHIVQPKAFRSLVAVKVSLLDIDRNSLASDRFALREQPGLRLGEIDGSQIAMISPYWILRALHATDNDPRSVQTLSLTMRTTRAVSIDLDDLKLVKTNREDTNARTSPFATVAR